MGQDFGDYRYAQITGTVWNDDGDGVNHLTIADSVGPTATTFTMPSSSLPVAIPDQNSIDIPISVSGMNNNILQVKVTVNITHPYASDLELGLVSPNNTTVLLANRLRLGDVMYGDGQNFVSTVFDDSASGSITTASAVHGFVRTGAIDVQRSEGPESQRHLVPAHYG